MNLFQINKIKSSTIFHPKKSLGLILIMFFLLIGLTTWAQPNNNNQKKQNDYQNQPGQNQGIAPVDINEPQLEDGKSIEEGRKMKEDYAVWKEYRILEPKLAKNNISVDSLFNEYNTKRFNKVGQNCKSTGFILPNVFVAKLTNLDSTIIPNLLPWNKHFSFLFMNKEMVSETVYNQIQSFYSSGNLFKISTFDLIAEVLPPIIINEKPVDKADYKNKIDLFFTNSPYMVYYCSSDFLYLIATNQYERIIKLQLATKNQINITRINK